MKRIVLIDTLRGLAVIHMILYHFMYDLVYLVGMNIPFFHTVWAVVWQKMICMTFILIAGYCHHFSRRHLRKSVILFVVQLLISMITIFFLPQERIVYGIIFLLWIADILMMVVSKWNISPKIGCIGALLLFLLTHRISQITVSHDVFAFLGIHSSSFYSSDYFPVFPWFFLYAVGYYWKEVGVSVSISIRENFFSFCGKHALFLYFVHQPVLYMALKLGGFL